MAFEYSFRLLGWVCSLSDTNQTPSPPSWFVEPRIAVSQGNNNTMWFYDNTFIMITFISLFYSKQPIARPWGIDVGVFCEIWFGPVPYCFIAVLFVICTKQCDIGIELYVKCNHLMCLGFCYLKWQDGRGIADDTFNQNTLRPRKIADDIFRCIFLNENVWIMLKISLKFVPRV